MENKPWEWDYIDHETEQEYLHRVVRGGIRQGVWNKCPVKTYFLSNVPVKRMINKKTGKMCQHNQCNICKEWVAKKSGSKKNKVKPSERMYVDHITPTRSFTKLEDAGQFIYDLVYCPVENLQHLCFYCHNIKTHSERKNITFEEARVDKLVVRIMDKNVHDLKIWLEHRHEEYLTPKPKNKETVRRLLSE
jgi:hypothetical protein